MDPELDDVPDLTEYYAVDDLGHAWHFTCFNCGVPLYFLKAFFTPLTRRLLLDHAKCCLMPPGEGVDRG